MRQRIWLAAVGLGLVLGAGATCFSPDEPPCAFSCRRAPAACPEHYTCGDDGLCHRNGAEGTCAIEGTPDAGGQ